ncbi:MAG: cyclic nucleotide-binding domain-containing protein [Rhodospirillaceae bacterium]|nr:MAG: cyclic nucleotide-binding domain-containing protein [Rhodospirillaceae bacterium]
MLQVHQQTRTVPANIGWREADVARRATLAKDPLAALESLGTTMAVRRGQEIYAEGDPAECCYKVVEGSVRTVKLVADGGRQIGDILLPGDFFGFDSFGEHYFSAQAISASVVKRYPRRAVVTRAQGDATLARHLNELTAKALQAARRQMVRLCRTSASERMASFLLEMADRSEGADGYIHLPMSRSDIADYLGLVIETVSRVFSQFKQDRLITMKDVNHIRLVDRDMLVELQGDI